MSSIPGMISLDSKCTMQDKKQTNNINTPVATPIGSNKNQTRNNNVPTLKSSNPLTQDLKKQQERLKVAANKVIASNKSSTTADAPFMKSVLPVTSLFSSIKSGVQTSVTAAVKAGKKSLP